MRPNNILVVMAAVSFFLSQPAAAELVLNEIMYDLPGSDTGREWVEIANIGSSAVTVATSTWKFFEANTNHSLSLFQGNLSIPAGGFALIVDDPNKFLLDWPGFGGTIFDSAFSLNNNGETIALKSDATTSVDQMTYASTTGASGDGNSLQKIGSVWRAASPSPGFSNSDQTGSAGVSLTASPRSDGGVSGPSGHSSETDLVSSGAGSASNWPVEPRIFSRVIGPATGIAGADIIFRAEAIGLDKQPIGNARFLWNFGDGATKEGEAVLHVYNFPADYVVILDVSSGKFSATNHVRLKIVPADIVISDVVPGPEGKIDLLNNSNQELDLSWWRLESGNQFFTLPKNSVIIARGRLPLSSTITGLNANPRDTALLYPNGVAAYRYEAAPTASTSLATAKQGFVEEDKASLKVASAVTSSQKLPRTVSAPPTSEPFQSQTAAVAEASGDQSGGGHTSQAAEKATTKFSSLWLYGALTIIILGVVFALLPKPVRPKDPADEFEIIED